MPDEIEGASAAGNPSPGIDAQPSLLDSMVDAMAAKEDAKNNPAPAPEVAPVQAAAAEAPPVEEKPAIPPPAAEEDDLGLGKLIKKPAPKVVPPAAKPVPNPAKVKSDADEKISWDKAPGALRGAFQKAKTELDAANTRLAETEAKLKAAETRPVPPEVEAKWKADLENEKKRAEALEENIRIVSYEKSQQFKDEHQIPIETAWKSVVKSLVGQEVEVSGIPKTVTLEDVNTVIHTESDIQARRKARELVGDDATDAILRARDKIRDLEAKKTEALETWRTKGTEHQQKQAEEEQQLVSTASKTFEERMASYVTRYPEVWEPKTDEEKEGKVAADKLVRMAFLGENLPKFASKAEHWNFSARLKADIAARAVATPILMVRNNALEAKVAALEEQLAGYKVSDPEVGNKGEGEGRKPARPAANGGGGLSAALAMIDAAPGT